MRYPIEVFWSSEDEGFIAIAPDLPGASVWGKSEADAIEELHTVIGLWIKASRKAGNPVPKPSNRCGRELQRKVSHACPETPACGACARRQGPGSEPQPVPALHADQGTWRTHQAGRLTAR